MRFSPLLVHWLWNAGALGVTVQPCQVVVADAGAARPTGTASAAAVRSVLRAVFLVNMCPPGFVAPGGAAETIRRDPQPHVIATSVPELLDAGRRVRVRRDVDRVGAGTAVDRVGAGARIEGVRP